jgi:hypothetical protein
MTLHHLFSYFNRLSFSGLFSTFFEVLGLLDEKGLLFVLTLP